MSMSPPCQKTSNETCSTASNSRSATTTPPAGSPCGVTVSGDTSRRLRSLNAGGRQERQEGQEHPGRSSGPPPPPPTTAGDAAGFSLALCAPGGSHRARESRADQHGWNELVIEESVPLP